MLRFAMITLFLCSVIGAMMPAGPASTKAGSAAATSSSSAFSIASSGTQVDPGSGAITLDRDSDGHFYAEAQVNGMPVRFLVDTGATGIALTREDAQRAAIPLSQENQVVGSGASGEVLGQYVSLDRVTLGPKEVTRTDAVVLEGGERSLLGQSFLSQFSSVNIEGDRMVLR